MEYQVNINAPRERYRAATGVGKGEVKQGDSIKQRKNLIVNGVLCIPDSMGFLPYSSILFKSLNTLGRKTELRCCIG